MKYKCVNIDGEYGECFNCGFCVEDEEMELELDAEGLSLEPYFDDEDEQ